MSDSDSFNDDTSDLGDSSENENDWKYHIKSKEHFAFCSHPEKEGHSPKNGKDNFMDKLLESSNSVCYPKYKGQNIVADDWDEAIIGWKELAPNAKYLPKRKRKKNVESESEKPKGGPILSSTNLYRNEDTKGSQSGSMWKSNVEPVTYRYIPNNGQYRLHKFCKEEREWYTVRRRNPERVTPTLKARYVQREIKRQMRKDFARKSDDKKGDVKRSQSTNSESHRDRTSNYSSLVKSASDLYVENIDSRLNELDKEIKKDSQIMKSHDEPNHPFPFNITKGKLHAKLKDTPVVPRKPTHEVQSTFMITSVGPQETQSLRPLEKITPQQRMKEDLVKVTSKKTPEDSGGGDTPNSETIAQTAIDVANFDLERLRIMPLAETSRTYIDRIVKSKQDSSNLMTPTKKTETQFLSSIMVGEPGLTSLDDLNIRGTESQPHSSRSRGMKEPNLPEIAGRRLEVSLTNYRLM